MKKESKEKPKWEVAINEARSIIKNQENAQMKVAELAFEVCEITYGGAVSRNLYTMKRFASEAGLDPKTLSNWVRIYRNVYVKLYPHIAAKTSFTGSKKRLPSFAICGVGKEGSMSMNIKLQNTGGWV